VSVCAKISLAARKGKRKMAISSRVFVLLLMARTILMKFQISTPPKAFYTHPTGYGVRCVLTTCHEF
jgi:hypothetical protein